MPSFITRISLEGSTAKDLQKLEEEMKKLDFRRDGKTTAKRKIAQPSIAEFNRNGNSLLEVTGAATRAVRKTGHNYPFTVIKERKLSLH